MSIPTRLLGHNSFAFQRYLDAQPGERLAVIVAGVLAYDRGRGLISDNAGRFSPHTRAYDESFYGYVDRPAGTP